MTVYAQSPRYPPADAGYTTITWLVVCNLAFSGLLVSWVMKFADSIVKVYATSLAMLLTTGGCHQVTGGCQWKCGVGV